MSYADIFTFILCGVFYFWLRHLESRIERLDNRGKAVNEGKISKRDFYFS